MDESNHQTPPTGSPGPIHADPASEHPTATTRLVGPHVAVMGGLADDQPTPEPTRPPFRAHSVSRPGLIPGGTGVELRDVEPDDVAERLRGMLGLTPEQPAPGEAAASYRRTLPPLVQSLDAGGWIAWCLAGLVVFGEGFPALAKIRRESKRVGLALALVRAQGRISPAARMLGATRKVVRENLRALGLIPWGVASTDEAAACEAGEVRS